MVGALEVVTGGGAAAHPTNRPLETALCARGAKGEDSHQSPGSSPQLDISGHRWTSREIVAGAAGVRGDDLMDQSFEDV
jgi:hypothetical protein